MNATPLPSPPPEQAIPQLRRRAAAVIAAWTAWRAARLNVDRVIDAGVLITMLIVWGCAYCLVCPPEPSHRPVQASAALKAFS